MVNIVGVYPIMAATSEAVTWTPELLREFGVETYIAGPGTVQKTRELPGELVFQLNHVSHVTLRYAGVIKVIYAYEGDTVKQGDTLAIIESNDSLTNYHVKAPLSGVVTEQHLTLGESLSDNTHIFTIADPSFLWVDFNVYSDIADTVKAGDAITIRNMSGDKLSTHIDFMSPVQSTSTRTRRARASITASTSQWVSGMFVSVFVPLEKIKSDIVIPKSALHKQHDQWIVFVKQGTSIRPSVVIPGSEDDVNVVIKSGLVAGECVVTTGSFILKADLDKESFEAE